VTGELDPLAGADPADASDGDGEVAVEHVAWEGSQIDAADAMLERALAYGMYVNKGRALPDVRDGLKPVQRRIVFAMDEIGARAGRPFVKSATVIGHVIGYYHPHGDVAVYDAMVRLAQSFSQNVPLVEGQGNWGSVGPKEFSDPAAAYRYTEARLTPAATEWLADMRPEVVEFRKNFTEKRSEPFVLPVTFPNLLVNGSRGIGWSMACEVPPHNLAEACDAAILLAEDPEAAAEEVAAVMPGPDFPTGGIIVDPEGIAEAYQRGQGTFRLQARFHIEQLPGNTQAVVVTELPYGVSPDQIVAEVVRAARAERISDVTEMPKNLSDRLGLRVQIRCKRGGNITKLITDLMRQTSLRITVGINMTVLVDGVPRQISMREALDRFVSFRFEVVTRRLEHERQVLLRELRRLVALLAALDTIDEVIRIVRDSEDDDDARERLKLKLRVILHGTSVPVPVDDEQAQQILDMPIKRLARLNRLKLEQEREAKGARVDQIGETLDSYEALRAIVVGELRDTRDRYATARRTRLGGDARPVSDADAATSVTSRKAAISVVSAPRTDIWLFGTDNGSFATRPREARLVRAPLIVGASDRLRQLTATDTESELHVFTSNGTVFRLRVADVPIETRASPGTKAVALTRGASIAGVIGVDEPDEYLLLATDRGEVKRAHRSVFAGSHMAGMPAFDVPSGDRLVAVVAHADGDEILLCSEHGKALRIDASSLRPVKSPGAGGVAGISLRADDRLVAVTLARADHLLVVHAGGHAKLVPMADYPRKGRGTGGVISADPQTPRREPAGEIATAVSVAIGADALILTAGGNLTRVTTGSGPLAPTTRSAVSRPLVDVVVGDTVVAAVPT
jgi:DNA gyrase subunit A